MRSTFVKTLIVSSSLLCLLACNKKDAILGAKIIAPSESFKVTKDFLLNTDSVDFTADGIKAEVEFNEKINFTVRVTGVKSGAVRTLDFQSTKLDLNEVLWNGNHEGLKYFRNKENVTIELDFAGDEISSLKKKVFIKQRRDFVASNPDRIIASEYSDLEEVPGRQIGTNFRAQKWKFFSAYSSDITNPETQQHLLLNKEVSRDEVPVFEGDSCLRFDIINDVKTGYRGGCDFVYGTNFQSQFVLYPLSDYSAEDVYLNFYIYGTDDPAVTLDFVISEDDDLSGVYSPTSEDRYLVTIPNDFKGWKLFSYQYSGLPRATNIEFGGNGNKVRETNKIIAVSVAYNSSKTGKHIVYIDNVFFSIGEAFDPTKF